jgi:hypothetical protein
MRSSRPRVIVLLILMLVSSAIAGTEAHRSGCHRWHSSPSDHGTYTCGDLGYCFQCPDNEYCLGGNPRTAVQKPTKPQPSLPEEIPTAAVKRVIDGDTVETHHRRKGTPHWRGHVGDEGLS